MGQNKNTIKPQIMLVDDNAKFLSEMKDTLSLDFEVTTAIDAQSAMSLMTNKLYELLLLDFEMPNLSGLEFLKLLKRRNPEIPVIMLTAKIASESRDIEIIGASKVATKLKSDILKLKDTSAFVLITGENGIGKELIARNLNAQEDDSTRPVFDRKADATAWKSVKLAEKRQFMSTGVMPVMRPVLDQVKFKEFAKWWLKTRVKARSTLRTCERYDMNLRIHVYPMVGALLLTQSLFFGNLGHTKRT